MLKNRKYLGIDLVNYFSSGYVSENISMFMPRDISHIFFLISSDDGNIMTVVSKIAKESLDAVLLDVLHWGYIYP